MPTGEDHLTVTVAPAFPFSRATVHFETSQDSFVQAVHVAFMKYRAVELVLHVDVFPNGFRGETVATSRNFHERCALTVSGGDEETILIDRDRLRDVDAHVGVPVITPE